MTVVPHPASRASSARRAPRSGLRVAAALIIADDLSGAADCGAACVDKGLQAIVALGPTMARLDVDVLAVDANTRAMNAEAAAEETERLVSTYGRLGPRLMFKKLDSTLRGHLGPELAAFLRAVRSERPGATAVLAPAFPALGRTTVGGRQRLHGAPLENTDLWRGAGPAYLPAILKADGLGAGLLPLALVRAGGDALVTAMRELARRVDVVVCDAETDADLGAVARASLALADAAVWAGSAGLFGLLVEAAGLSRPPRAPAAPAARGSALFVVGSRSRVSLRQAASLAMRDGIVSITADLTASAEALRASGAAAKLAETLDAGEDAIIWQGPEDRGDGGSEARPCLGLAALVAAHKERIGALFATGGDTARRLLGALDIDRLELVEQVEPGVPLAVAVGPRRIPVITKAGAFGDDATMVRCRSAFRRSAGATPERGRIGS